MKKKIAMGWLLLLMGTAVVGAEIQNAAAESFKPNRTFKVANGKISNKTMYAGNISCEIQNMKTFSADFKLTLLPKSKKETGFFSVCVDVGNAKWSYLINTAANGAYGIKKLHNPAEKTVRTQYFTEKTLSPDLFKNALAINVEFKDGVFKIKFADQVFEQKLNAASATLSFASYPQPVEIGELKISYEKDQVQQK